MTPQLLWSKEIECRAAHMQALDTHNTKCVGSIDRKRVQWTNRGIDGFHSIFHHRNWRAKVSCDVDIDQSAASMVM